MKKRVFWGGRHIYYVIILLLIIACSKETEEDNSTDTIKTMEQTLATTNTYANPELRYFQNKGLPIGKKKLNILCLGNSYTIDALANVPDILEGAGIQHDNITIYFGAFDGASLQRWYKAASTGEIIKLTHHTGNRMQNEKGTLEQLLEQDWDIITLQQYSVDATLYTTFNPYLRFLIDMIRDHCLNPDVALAWQVAWSYSESFGPYQSSYYRWLCISAVVQQMVINDGIDILIPIGTAIQNARCTELNTTSELTRDGTHLDLGVGRYIAACTWVQALVAPVFSISVIGNSSFPCIGFESETMIYESRPLSIENIKLCQLCAISAVTTPFAITHLSSK